MRLKKALIVALTALVITVPTQQASAGYNDNPLPDSQRQYQWTVAPKSRPYVRVPGAWVASEYPTGLVGEKALMPYVVQEDGNGMSICQTVTKSCIENSIHNVDGFFTLCVDDATIACIDSVEFQIDGTWKQAQVTQRVDETPDPAALAAFLKVLPKNSPATSVVGALGWDAIPEIGLPSSAKGPVVITMPGVTNQAGKDTYVLNANYTYSKPLKRIYDYALSVRPVKIDSSLSNSMFRWVSNANGDVNVRGTSNYQLDFNDETVAASSTKGVGWAAGFGSKVPIRVNLRLPKSLGGWFQSRLENPDVVVNDFDSATNIVSLAGSPVTVPITEGAIDVSNPANQSAVVSLMGQRTWDETQTALSNSQGGSPGLLSWTIWYPQAGVEGFNRWKAFIPDKALGTADVWMAGHINANSACMASGSSLQGLVNTNALTFQPNVPNFDNGFLSYQVAGVHYDSSGKIFQGTYDFIMRKSVAQCLYGFDNSPISGIVSVTSADGAEQVATTSVSESDGWLKLAAHGFTFSNPTISAKLEQKSAAIPSVANALKVTKAILCIKGKALRKVIGTAPKCPVGYKKK